MFEILFFTLLGVAIGLIIGYLIAYKKHLMVNFLLKENLGILEKNLAIAQNELEIHRQNQDEMRHSLRLELNELTNRLFDSHDKKFATENEKRLESFLKPFREQVEKFEQEVKNSYLNEAKERHSLSKEISSLKNLNERISQDAQNLTSALKGNSKTQGDWGEMILERILEDSGLVNGIEYKTQKKFVGEDKKTFIPDAIVYLPENRSVIIDSKVSLLSYYNYRSSESEVEQKEAIEAHLSSVNKHINILSKKEYEKIKEIRTLDFVLMFVPIEGAFLLAVSEDPMIYKRAYESGVLITGPSTLMLTLRIIENIWRRENQNKNVELIAQKASELYDGFVLFAEELEKVGKEIDQANSAYQNAWKRLSTGRGNLMNRAQEFKNMGVQSKKELKYNEQE